MVALVGDDPMARCSLTRANDLHGAPGQSGMIGHYEALDADAGAALLQRAARGLTARGAVRVLGPMNGSTWASYRLALPALPDDERGDQPFFVGEPRNPFEYVGHFERAGFTVCANYESRSDLLASQSSAEPALPDAMATGGVTVEHMDPTRFVESLREVYALSVQAFIDNPYYAPISVEQFVASYVPLQPLLEPRLVLLAREPGGALVSLLFGYPDPLWRPDGRPERAILKTIATAPEYRGMRISRHLLAVFRARAAALGFVESIHALMHVRNTSMRLSGEHESVLFRRYALYEWTP
jgi:GNAT superfamily N-acetyltransferase